MTDPSSFVVDISRAPGLPEVDGQTLRHAVSAVLHRHGRRAATISLALVDDARIADINLAFLGHEGATDVISFDLRGGDEAEIDGELVISLETAQREASRRGHDVTAEATLYAIHGTLHLLGFDDADDARAERMHEEEDAVLAELNLALGREPAARAGMA